MVLMLFFFLLCYVSYQDITKRKIFNHSVLCGLVIGCLFLLLPDGNRFSIGWSYSLSAAAIFFVFFLVFYRIGWMGAGDVKWGAILAFCFGMQAFFYIWVISVVMAVIYGLVLNLFAFFRSGKMNAIFFGFTQGKKHVPYGALLSISAMIFILGESWF